MPEPAASNATKPERDSYHHGNLREALIHAALAQLEQNGDERLALRELARQVGVTPNAVYRHFAGKEALLVALATEGFVRLRAAQEEAERGADSPRESVLETGLAYIRFAVANPALFRLMMGRFSAGRRDPGLDEAMRRCFDEHRGRIQAATQREIDERELSIRAIHALAVAHGLSLLQLDGQIENWTASTGITVGAVMELAARLRFPPQSSRA